MSSDPVDKSWREFRSLTPRAKFEIICQHCLAGEAELAKLCLHNGYDEGFSSTELGEACLHLGYHEVSANAKPISEARHEIIHYILSADFTNPLKNAIYELTFISELRNLGLVNKKTVGEWRRISRKPSRWSLVRENFWKDDFGNPTSISIDTFSIPDRFVMVQIPISNTADIELRLLAPMEKQYQKVNTIRDLENFVFLAANKQDRRTIEFLLKNITDNRACVLEPLLYFAAKIGEARIVKLLLEGGVTMDIQDGEHNFTPLHLAAQKGAEIVADILIQYGADLDRTDKYRRTPLYYAAKIGWTKGAKILLENGASVNVVDKLKTTPLKAALMGGYFGVMDLLVRYGADLDFRENLEELTSFLRIAAEKGDAHVVGLLLDIASVDSSGRFKIENSKTHCKGIQKISEEPTQSGCPDLKSTPDQRDQDRREGEVSCNEFTSYGEGCSNLESALDRGDKIFRRDCTDIDDCSNFKSAPNRGERNHENEEISFGDQRNEERSGTNRFCFDINECSPGDRSLLMSASSGGNADVVQLLLDHGADINFAQPEWGTTAPHVAVQYGHVEVVDLLLNRGADLESLQLEFYSPLTTAALIELCHSERPRLAPDKERAIIEALLSHGADIRILGGGSDDELPPSYDDLGVRFCTRYSASGLQVALELGLLTDLAAIHRLQHTTVLWFEESNSDEDSQVEEWYILARYVVKLQVAGRLPTPILDDSTSTCRHSKCAEEKFPSKAVLLNKLVASADFLSPGLRDQCKVEVAKMKRLIPGSDAMYLDLFSMSPDQLARLSRNKELFQSLIEKNEDEFPLYHIIMNGRLARGNTRRRWVDSASRICHRIFNWAPNVEKQPHETKKKVPYEVTERVMKCLSDQDLRRFVLDHENDPVWQRLAAHLDAVYPLNVSSQDSYSTGDMEVLQAVVTTHST